MPDFLPSLFNPIREFSFGRNWKRFADKYLDDSRIHLSERHMLEFLGLEDLSGLTFVDAGCGSGLHSVAALQAGAARITSFDRDPDAVATAESVRAVCGSPDNWTVFCDDILDPTLAERIEPADIVYCWGVLHHTGDKLTAFANVSRLARPGGLLYVSFYTCGVVQPSDAFWLDIKKRYNRAGFFGRRVWEFWYLMRFRILWDLRVRSDLWEHLFDYHKRGMELFTDIRDWLGGWPMEFSTVQEITWFAENTLGLELVNIRTGEANTEYLFRRP